MTEKQIYLTLLDHKIRWSVPLRRRFSKRYGFPYHESNNDTRYEFAISTLPPILPEEKEVIKRCDWNLESLKGETEKQLFHPHYDILKQHIFENHKRKHDILVIFECSNSKPYELNKTLKPYVDKWKDKADFASISNPGIIPFEYSNYYPYRYDEWNHFNETKEIEDLYVKVNTERFFEFIDKMGYKEVVIHMQHHKPRRLFDELPPSPHIHITITKDFEDKMIEKYRPVYKNLGLTRMRILRFKETKKLFDDTMEKLTSV